MRLFPPLAAVLLTVSSAIPAAHAAANKTACDLLTLPEVAALAGVPMGPGRAVGPTCAYAGTNGPSFVSIVMAVNGSVEESAEFLDMTATIEKSRSGQHPPLETIPGVGDRAILTYDNDGTATLTVASHLTVLQLTNRAGSVPMAPARKQAMIDAMKKMISRM